MNLPKIKFQTLKEAREEMARFSITEKAPTLQHARKLLLAKRAELAKANKAKHIENVATPTVDTISKPTIAPVATAKASPVAKSAVFDVANYLGLRMKQISCVWLNKFELAILSVSNDATSAIESAIETLSKTDQYHYGVLLSNAYRTLQSCEATKSLDSRDILNELKTSKAIKAKSDRDQAHFANWRTSSK